MARRRTVVGQRIRDARDELNLTQREVAVRVSVADGQTVSNWERGVYEPDYDTLERLARVLKKPVSYFFAEEDEVTPRDDVAELRVQMAQFQSEVLDRIADLERLLRDQDSS